MTSVFAACAMVAGAANAAVPAAEASAFFTRADLAETRALIVLQDGKPVIERFGKGYGPDNRFISWSMAKSVTATLVGILVGKGRLSLDAPAPVPEWHKTPGDPRAKITLAQLLHMSSGLAHEESVPVGRADTNRALFSDQSADAAHFAETKGLEAAPGAKYEYSTQTSVILAAIVQRTIAPEAKTPEARRAAMRTFIAQRLARPAGMESLICEFDASGTMLGGSLCHATARDWARFGQLYLDNGVAGGVQVVPKAWVAFVRTPAANDGGYGGQFWLNRPRPAGSNAALFPAQGPAGLYAAIGHLGQYVLIAPSKRLVVVRLGKTQDDVLPPLRAALGRLVNSYPDASAPAPQGPIAAGR